MGCQPVPGPPEVDGRNVCALHGGLWAYGSECLTRVVLDDVATRRLMQNARWGANRDVPDGTGRNVCWTDPIVSICVDDPRGIRVPRITAEVIERAFRDEWDWKDDGEDDPAEISWLRMVREEVAEAFKEDADDRNTDLDDELLDVAALCVSWIERRRERRFLAVQAALVEAEADLRQIGGE